MLWRGLISVPGMAPPDHGLLHAFCNFDGIPGLLPAQPRRPKATTQDTQAMAAGVPHRWGYQFHRTRAQLKRNCFGLPPNFAGNPGRTPKGVRQDTHWIYWNALRLTTPDETGSCSTLACFGGAVVRTTVFGPTLGVWGSANSSECWWWWWW